MAVHRASVCAVLIAAMPTILGTSIHQAMSTTITPATRIASPRIVLFKKIIRLIHRFGAFLI
nr:MAG TPA: hypothetical protein [Caudoviricetes sp.]